MVIFLKNFLKFKTIKFSRFGHFRKSFFSTELNHSDAYLTKITLKEPDYEKLWINTQQFLTNKSDRINFEEFKALIDQVHVLIDFWKSKDGNFKNKPVRIFLESTFSDPSTSLSQKFISNSTNWSAIYQNIDKISNLIDNTNVVKSKVNIYLDDMLDFYLFEYIYRLQDNQSFTGENIKDFYFESTNLDQMKFYVDLCLSLYNYLSHAERISIQKDENLSFFLIKTGLIYVEKFLFVNKSSVKYLEKNADKKNSNILTYLAKMETHLEQVMKNYKNFNSIQEFKKNDFFRIFSFFESKWLNSSDWLMNINLSKLNNQHHSLFVYAASGSIRFENFAYFEKLTINMNKLSSHFNLLGKNYMNLNLLFRAYFNTLMTEKNNLNLDNLLSLWSKIDYVPNHNGLSNLKFYIEFLNSKSKEYKYSVRKIRVGLNGRVFESNFCLESFKFNQNDLIKISELIKENILSSAYLQSEKMDELKKIDDLLCEKKFDFVIDGMNIVFLRHNPNNFENIMSLIELINNRFRDKNCLIFLRDHVFKRNKGLIRKIMDLNHQIEANNRIVFYCIDSIFEDDKFFLYSAVKSSGNTMIISNDYFSNQSHFLNEYGSLFREWLFNRKITVELSTRRIFLPPKYKLKCNIISDNKWILPYLNDANNPRNHNFVLIEKLDRKNNKT